jgi:hypothetical protein
VISTSLIGIAVSGRPDSIKSTPLAAYREITRLHRPSCRAYRSEPCLQGLSAIKSAISGSTISELEQKRTRVGQWNQLHGFLPILRLVLLRLFPNFDDRAKEHGERVLPMMVPDAANLEGKKVLVDPSFMPPTITASRMRYVLPLIVGHDDTKNP